jgi:hypothetical protein
MGKAICGYFIFLRKCFSWSFMRWEKGEAGMSLAPPLISALNWLSVVGILTIRIAACLEDAFIYIPIGILLLMIFVIAPYKLWKMNNDKLEELITPRLTVFFEPNAPLQQRGNVDWHHLRVHNPTGKAIPGCYCKLVEFRAKGEIPEYIRLPRPGIRFPWSTHGGGVQERITVKIASGSFDIVDIAVCKIIETPDKFLIPILDRDQYTRLLEYPLPLGDYEVDIEVGSDDLDFAPTLKTFVIKFAGGFAFEISDITS